MGTTGVLASLLLGGGIGSFLNYCHVMSVGDISAALGVSTAGVLALEDSSLTVGLGSTVSSNLGGIYLHIVLELNNVAALNSATTFNGALEDSGLTVGLGCTVRSNGSGLNLEGVSRSLCVNRLVECLACGGATLCGALDTGEVSVLAAGRIYSRNDLPLVNGVVVGVNSNFSTALGVFAVFICALVNSGLTLGNTGSVNSCGLENEVMLGSGDSSLGLNNLVTDGAGNFSGLTCYGAGRSNGSLGDGEVSSLGRGNTVAVVSGNNGGSLDGSEASGTVLTAGMSVNGSGSSLVGSIYGSVILLGNRLKSYNSLVTDAALDTGGLAGLLAGSFLSSGKYILVCGVSGFSNGLAFLDNLAAILTYHLCADTFLEAGGLNDSGSIGISLDVSVLARIVFTTAGYKSSNGEK